MRRATTFQNLMAALLQFLSTLSLRRATSTGRAAPVDGPISIHALLAESDVIFCQLLHGLIISIHALLAESDPAVIKNRTAFSVFLSTLSLRRATHNTDWHECHRLISIHALLAESDQTRQPRHCKKLRFLSTLSLRRATGQGHLHAGTLRHFYPRSPCGERRTDTTSAKMPQWISIHALLAESDHWEYWVGGYGTAFLSTLSLRRATRTQSAFLSA